jgi:hypothetical protein
MTEAIGISGEPSRDVLTDATRAELDADTRAGGLGGLGDRRGDVSVAEARGQTDQESRSILRFAVGILLMRHKPAARTIGLSSSGLLVRL